MELRRIHLKESEARKLQIMMGVIMAIIALVKIVIDFSYAPVVLLLYCIVAGIAHYELLERAEE